jgi:hypothetical protein
MQVAFGSPRDDFGAAVVARSVLDDGGNEQRCAHHLTHQCHETVFLNDQSENEQSC